jgi:membrane associated rhomboid family serine protease
MVGGRASGWCWRVIGCYVTISGARKLTKSFLTIQALRAVAALLVGGAIAVQG